MQTFTNPMIAKDVIAPLTAHESFLLPDKRCCPAAPFIRVNKSLQRTYGVQHEDHPSGGTSSGRFVAKDFAEGRGGRYILKGITRRTRMELLIRMLWCMLLFVSSVKRSTIASKIYVTTYKVPDCQKNCC